MNPLSRLPNEVNLHIVSFLDDQSLLVSAPTNKQIKSLVDNDPLWKLRTLSKFGIGALASKTPDKGWKQIYKELETQRIRLYKNIKMSNKAAAQLALIPGAAEYLDSRTSGNWAWNGHAKELKYSRNILYASTAVTILGTTGAVFSRKENTDTTWKCAIVATLSFGVAIWAAKKLYDTSLFFKDLINSDAKCY